MGWKPFHAPLQHGQNLECPTLKLLQTCSAPSPFLKRVKLDFLRFVAPLHTINDRSLTTTVLSDLHGIAGSIVYLFWKSHNTYTFYVLMTQGFRKGLVIFLLFRFKVIVRSNVHCSTILMVIVLLQF